MHKFYLPLFRGIKIIRPLDLVEYNKEDASNFLVSNYGYQKYAQKHFEFRFTSFMSRLLSESLVMILVKFSIRV